MDVKADKVQAKVSLWRVTIFPDVAFLPSLVAWLYQSTPIQFIKHQLFSYVEVDLWIYCCTKSKCTYELTVIYAEDLCNQGGLGEIATIL